jgi:exodeoxyribonuclease V gamma subunit
MVSIRIVYHCRIEGLADALIERLKTPGQRPIDPFSPLKVSVPDSGTGTWLKQRLATSLGVAAHIDLDFPNTLLSEIVSDAVGTERPWESTGLDWAILDVLAGLEDGCDPQLEPLRRYLEQTEGPRTAASPLGRPAVSLAHELASLFDRYVAYRPTLARGWSKGESSENERDDLLAWQPGLWQKVARLLGPPSRLREVLEVTSRSPIRFFAPTDFSAISLERLQAIARYIPMEIYCLVHSVRAIEEIEALNLNQWTGRSRREFDTKILMDLHSLYAACGTLERDLLINLSALGSSELTTSLKREGSEKTSHLAAIQAAISGPQNLTPIDFSPADDSFSVHRCHGPRRQIEILHDLLRQRFDEHDTLQPRDVLVLVPNMTDVAPIIDAVFMSDRSLPFDASRTRLPAIPYAIVGQGVRRLNPIADVLLRVLKLGEESARFEATAVLDLLSFEPVLSRFGLEQDDVNTIQTWVLDAGIRWGMDGEHHSEFAVGDRDLPADDQNSWTFGLERLLLGVVMADESETLFDGSGDLDRLAVRPIDDMEGSQAILVGRFADFVNTLMMLVGDFKHPRTPRGWFDLILGHEGKRGVLERLMRPTDDFQKHARSATRTLQEFRQATSGKADAARITIQGIRGFLEHKLDSVESTYSGGGSAVTFAPIHSHARVPARVVVLLGFDAGVFPRGPRHHQFDLTVVEPRIGDKTHPNADRARFLDAVMSARESLAVLYTGFDLHTNEEIPPSIVVSELCDAADSAILIEGDDNIGQVGQRLTKSHPLQAFSPRAFNTDPKYSWSYDPHLLMAAQASLRQDSVEWRFLEGGETISSPNTTEDDALEVVSLDALIAFFKDPAEQLLRRRFKMFSNRQGARVTDRETIELAIGLDQWSVRKSMLDACLLQPGVDFEAIRDSDAIRRSLATGTLPWGGQAHRVLRQAHEEMMTALEKVHDAIDLADPLGDAYWDDPQDVEIDLAIEGRTVRIVARLDTIRDNYLLCLHASSGGAHHLAAGWLKGLVWAASREASPGAVVNCFLGGKKPESSAYVVSDLQATFGRSVQEVLESAVRLYLRGHQEPVPFFSPISHEIAWALRAYPLDYETWWQDESDAKMNRARLSALSKVRKGWPDHLKKSGPSMLFGSWDPFVQRGDKTFFDRHLYEIATEFWWPAFATRRTATKIAGCV